MRSRTAAFDFAQAVRILADNAEIVYNSLSNYKIDLSNAMKLFFNHKKNLKKFNLVHCIPPYNHGLNGYKEVIESIKWGLEQLGHEVSYGVNNFNPNCTNIIFGAQMIGVEMLKKIPSDSIIYNLEQLRNLVSFSIAPAELHLCATQFEIWDYNADNLKEWKKLGNTVAKLVPIGYAPVLNRIEKREHQDIDVLIYGTPGDLRLSAFKLLAMNNLKVVFVSGFYGEERDELIARAKLVLNTHYYESSKIFEIARVSYLLSNKKAVVTILEQDTSIDDDMKSAVRCSSFETLVDDCRELLGDESLRANLENKGFQIFSCRDIRETLKNALSS